MKYPQIGEYWYVRTKYGVGNNVLLCECVGRIGNNSIMKHEHRDSWGFTRHKTFSVHVNSSNSSKWEPNWFYKLLGYK